MTDHAEKHAVEITVDGNDEKRKLIAHFEENQATQKLLNRMPFTIEMDNLYAREMCHRYGRGALPAKQSRDMGYRVGDISYWPPMGSLVILYKQNGEVFEQQPIGHIEDDISFFAQMKDARVTFRSIE